MCGIAGLIGIAPELAADAAPRMLSALRHRGPDDYGIVAVNADNEPSSVTLIHSRLSIIDLTADGHQPMCDAATCTGGTPNWIVFNGEIYNYRSLREELKRNGAAGRTQSDTEVILDAYRTWGDGAIERLRGMFAWCIV